METDKEMNDRFAYYRVKQKAEETFGVVLKKYFGEDIHHIEFDLVMTSMPIRAYVSFDLPDGRRKAFEKEFDTIPFIKDWHASLLKNKKRTTFVFPIWITTSTKK